MTYRSYFTIFALSFILFACQAKQETDYIAKVGNITISSTEFKYRYNFNPHLMHIQNENVAKRVVLSSLIAEKLLANEAVYKYKIDQDIDQKIRQHLREIMIEQFRRDSIESTIQVSTEEMKNEYQKSLKEIDIRFIAFDSKPEADKVKKQISEGLTFEEAVRWFMDSKGWQGEAIPAKTVHWAKEEDEPGSHIFHLKEKEVSETIKARGEYYLVKVIAVRQVSEPSYSDFNNRIPALRDRILRKKIKNRYAQFYKDNIKSETGSVNWRELHAILDILVGEMTFNQNREQNKLQKRRPLSDQIYLTANQINSQQKNSTIIKFPDGSAWDAAEVFRRLKYGPYAFNYQNGRAFRRTFAQNIQLMVEYEALYQLALKAGYENHPLVQDDFNMWAGYYKSNAYRHKMLKEIETDSSQIAQQGQLTSVQQNRLNYMDDYLSDLAGKYRIRIDKNIYSTVTLNKTDMTVMKTHFSNRLIAPFIEPLNGLPKWQKKMSALFKKNGIT